MIVFRARSDRHIFGNTVILRNAVRPDEGELKGYTIFCIIPKWNKVIINNAPTIVRRLCPSSANHCKKIVDNLSLSDQ